jgi:hypothetical protein
VLVDIQQHGTRIFFDVRTRKGMHGELVWCKNKHFEFTFFTVVSYSP